jgi:hypothetical protein
MNAVKMVPRVAPLKYGIRIVPYASVDIQNKFSDLIKELKNDSIWMKLELE